MANNKLNGLSGKKEKWKSEQNKEKAQIIKNWGYRRLYLAEFDLII